MDPCDAEKRMVFTENRKQFEDIIQKILPLKVDPVLALAVKEPMQ